MIDIANVIKRGLEFCHCDLLTDLIMISFTADDTRSQMHSLHILHQHNCFVSQSFIFISRLTYLLPF